MDSHLDSDIMDRLPLMLGKSPRILKIFKEIKRIAPKDIDVLISGERGTHKQLIAKAIHCNSKQPNNPFILVNLVSIPQESAEEELFGNGKTDSAEKIKIGKIEDARGGTLYLDEIHAMKINLQEKLLLFMREREIARTGEKPNVRMIGATCNNLKECVAKGLFREDLYDAFDAIHIKLPPLRERKEDILPIAQYCLSETVSKFETGPKEFSKDARDFLLRYDWPGNIRELENTIKKAAILSRGTVLTKKDLIMEDIGSCSMKEFLEEKLKRYMKEMTKLETCNLYNTVLSEVEKSLIRIVLQETGGNQLKAAKTLGINRNTLRTKIKEYKIRL